MSAPHLSDPQWFAEATCDAFYGRILDTLFDFEAPVGRTFLCSVRRDVSVADWVEGGEGEPLFSARVALPPLGAERPAAVVEKLDDRGNVVAVETIPAYAGALGDLLVAWTKEAQTP